MVSFVQVVLGVVVLDDHDVRFGHFDRLLERIEEFLMLFVEIGEVRDGVLHEEVRSLAGLFYAYDVWVLPQVSFYTRRHFLVEVLVVEEEDDVHQAEFRGVRDCLVVLDDFVLLEVLNGVTRRLLTDA